MGNNLLGYCNVPFKNCTSQSFILECNNKLDCGQIYLSIKLPLNLLDNNSNEVDILKDKITSLSNTVNELNTELNLTENKNNHSINIPHIWIN